jgi:hypothetical protein
MKTCEYAGDPFTEPRSHPWVDAVNGADCRYYDLTAAPALIRSALEDFAPWAQYAAIETFYALLERLNHRGSALESNDCAFTGPHASEGTQVDKALECSGRVMVLFRALASNTAAHIEWLKNEFHAELAALDPGFRWGVVGTTIVPARYLALASSEQLGSQLMISFWAWGDTEPDTMLNFGRLLKNLSHALRKVSARAAARGGASHRV